MRLVQRSRRCYEGAQPIRMALTECLSGFHSKLTKQRSHVRGERPKKVCDILQIALTNKKYTNGILTVTVSTFIIISMHIY